MAGNRFEFIRQIRELVRFPHSDNRARLRWILVAAAGLMFFLFLFGGPYGLFNLYRLKREKAALTAEIRLLNRQGDSLRQAIERLKNDPAEVERIAREHYGMAKKGEKVFRFAPTDKKD
jgi:cell division protein FtsB